MEKVEINLNENKVYIVKDQKLVELDSPQTGFGKQEIIWHNGEIVDCITQFKKRI